MKIAREKICLYSSMYPGVSSAEMIIDCAERFEVGGVELMNFCQELSTPDRAVARALGKRAREKGLALPCFSVGIDAIADPVASLEKLKGYAEICSELEIPYLHHTIALDYRCGRLPEEEWAKRFNTGTAIALELAEFCRPLGVRTLIEPQGFVFNGIDAVDRLIKMSDEKIGVVADVGNVYFYDTDPVEFANAMRGRICHCHLKDYTLTPPPTPTHPYISKDGVRFYGADIGAGDIDYDGFFAALKNGGYNGFYALEFEVLQGDVTVRRAIDFLLERGMLWNIT